MKITTYLASEFAVLDSNVYHGGGTDSTKALQAILDKANENEGVRLIMDGAALVSQLELSSNTVIECLTKDCGFYQKDGSDCAVLTNKIWDMRSRQTRNISLIGGTYNQNCKNQAHDVPATKALLSPGHDDRQNDMPVERHWVYGVEFYGVENFLMRDVTVRDFRTFAVMIGGFKNVTIEDVWLDLPGHTDAQNQDGFHFWGPGQFLNVKNTGGRVGDDFMNLGPDEHDGVSSITDVVVDGIFLEHADQAVRMLTYGTGTLDRVTLRNVSGTYRSFGFYINCWFSGSTYGDFKNIFIENVDLRQEKPNYNYRAPMLFSIGGNIESLTMKNIRHHAPSDNRTLFEIGIPFYDIAWKFPEDNLPKMKNIFIEDLKIIEDDDRGAGNEYIQVYLPLDNLVLKDVYAMRSGEKRGKLLTFKNTGKVGKLIMNDIFVVGLEKLVDEEEKCSLIMRSNVNNL